MSGPLRCVTWNVHRARGADGRVDPVRVEETLLAEVCPPDAAEILSLQEADTETPPHRGLLDVARIEGMTGLVSAHQDAALRWGPESHGFLGVLLFLSPRLTLVHAQALDLPGRCHRGAIVVEVQDGARRVRIAATHLSLGQPLRVAQLRTLGQFIFRRPPMPTILMGDLNEWRPWSGLALSHRVIGTRLAGPTRATFPVTRPFLPLDRILASPPARVRRARVLDGPGIRAASDHRPLAAEVVLPDA
ncbi:MAG: endonuclease/exonuclease/phosphatase family protein [Pseudomonadota bacterium]